MKIAKVAAMLLACTEAASEESSQKQELSKIDEKEVKLSQSIAEAF